VLQAVARLDAKREADQTSLVDNQLTVDGRLYEKFIDGADKVLMPKVRAVEPEQLSELGSMFHDERLKNLLPLYKARNYPGSLTASERAAWDEFCRKQLFDGGQSSRLARYFTRLGELAGNKLSAEQRYLLEELQLYGQSIVPSDVDADAIG
jgi:exodeoxyribonuclease-1